MNRYFVVSIKFVRVISVLFLISTAFAQNGPTIPVDCDKGQSLNSTLSRLNRKMPTTILVQGTCTEYVTIDGLENLTLKGQPGAAIQQPATNPQSKFYVLDITGSRNITVYGLAVHTLPIFAGIGISAGSRQVLLQDVDVDGSWSSFGVTVYEESQVWLVNVSVNTSGFAAISAFDKSDVHMAGGLLASPSAGGYHVGLFIGSAHVTLQGTTMRDMQQGIFVGSSGSVDIQNWDHGTDQQGVVEPVAVDVTIANPSGINSNGVIVSDSSSLNVYARLLISNAGQSWGGNTGAVFVTNGSTLNAGPNVVVSNSQGQGVIVTNNSHATLAGSSITGSLHGGLVVANLSTIDNASGSFTSVSGNATDLFCDSNSFITGTANLTGVSTVNCGNQLPNNTVPLP